MEPVHIGFWVIAGLVLVALVFDFMNGFHDAANAIATVVSTGVLKPHQAVAWAAFFNFVALFIFQLKVASTVGKGIVDPGAVDHYLIFGALLGAKLPPRQSVNGSVTSRDYGWPFAIQARASLRSIEMTSWSTMCALSEPRKHAVRIASWSMLSSRDSSCGVRRS